MSSSKEPMTSEGNEKPPLWKQLTAVLAVTESHAALTICSASSRDILNSSGPILDFGVCSTCTVINEQCYLPASLTELIVPLPSNIEDLIHALLFTSYTVGRCCMLRKHLGDSNFPITNKGRFSVPSMFAQTSTVILSLLFFQPVQVSLAAACVLSGSSCQNRPVPSVLNTPLASYCCRTG